MVISSEQRSVLLDGCVSCGGGIGGRLDSDRNRGKSVEIRDL